MLEHHFVLRPFVPRSTLSKAFIQVLVVPALIFWATAAVAQNNDDDNRVHIQPRESLMAQSQAQPSPQDSQNPPQADSTTQQQTPAPSPIQPVYLTVPAGTKLPLVLARPLSLKHTKPGDMAYLQTTFPITVGGQMAIPPGTFLQGTIEKITRKDRLYRVLGFELRSVQVIFSTGYTVTIAGPLEAEPVIGQSAAPEIETGDPPPVLAATGGPTPPPLPPLPPLPGAGMEKVFIGVGIAAAVGITVTSLVLINRNDILMHPGVSMEAVLPAPLELDEDRVMVAVQQYAGQPPSIPQPPTMGTCWTAGSPGTPDTVIPGTPAQTIPGTPDITIPGDPPTVIPGTPAVTIPGTPDTVIPGTPATDPAPYPCPK